MRLTPQLLTVSQHLSVDGDQGGGPTYASIVLREGQRSVATAQVNCLLVEEYHKKSIIITVLNVAAYMLSWYIMPRLLHHLALVPRHSSIKAQSIMSWCGIPWNASYHNIPYHSYSMSWYNVSQHSVSLYSMSPYRLRTIPAMQWPTPQWGPLPDVERRLVMWTYTTPPPTNGQNNKTSVDEYAMKQSQQQKWWIYKKIKNSYCQ